eukprot:1917624-Rhodomonas_salina.1
MVRGILDNQRVRSFRVFDVGGRQLSARNAEDGLNPNVDVQKAEDWRCADCLQLQRDPFASIGM